MSARWFNWARSQHVGRSTAKTVLLILGDTADQESGLSFPSITYLSEATELDRKTVIGSLAFLVERGYLEDTGDRAGRTRSVTVYRLSSPESGTASTSDDSNEAESEAQSGSQPLSSASDIKQSQKRDISENGSALKCESTSDSENGTALDESSPESGTSSCGSSPVFPLKQSRFSHSNEELTKSKSKTNAAARASARVREGEGGFEELDEQQLARADAAEAAKQPKLSPFERFWSIYPQQVGRVDCARTWRRMDLDQLIETIVADVERRKLHDDKWLRNFVPEPKNYLRGRRWEDVQPAVESAAQLANAPKPDLLRMPISPLDAGLALARDMLEAETYTQAQYQAEVARLQAKYPEAAAA